MQTMAMVTALAFAASGCSMLKTQAEILAECRVKTSTANPLGTPPSPKAIEDCVRDAQQDQFIEFLLMIGFVAAAMYLLTNSGGGGGQPFGAGAGSPGGG
jgi:hypothetical protein